MSFCKAILVGLLIAFICSANLCIAQDWPGVFDPNYFQTLNVDLINPADWDVIRYDMTFDIEVPALFWADGEEANKLYVSIRRKSCDAMPDEADPFKISVKIDINQYIDGQKWHGLNKLSLENGDDSDILQEGLAGNIHNMASGPEGYGYLVGYANWVRLKINGIDRGVYASVEQLDKQFLRNRGLYTKNEVWMYEYEGGEVFELEVGDELNPVSPGVEALCYRPMACISESSPLYPAGGLCPTPEGDALVTDLEQWVDVNGLLTIGAIDAFLANPDALFSHTRNTTFVDFNDVNDLRLRRYFPWDNDSVMSEVDASIYMRKGGPTKFQEVILGNDELRARFNRIMLDLLDGPLSEANIHGFLDGIEPTLTDALAADPYNQFGDPGAAGVAAHFVSTKQWITDRIANVRQQIADDGNFNDADADGISDDIDNCPYHFNSDQRDRDRDGIGDVCEVANANIDGIGAVDMLDFAILAADWLKTEPDLPGDTNGDNAVDQIDLEQISQNWLEIE